jgi:hypothetical protein
VDVHAHGEQAFDQPLGHRTSCHDRFEVERVRLGHEGSHSGAYDGVALFGALFGAACRPLGERLECR